MKILLPSFFGPSALATKLAIVALFSAGISLSPHTVCWSQDNVQDKEAVQENDPKKVEKSELGTTVNVHQCGSLFTAGQFKPEDIKLFVDQKITRVITLRTEGEIDWDEKAELEKAKIEYIEVPVRSPDTMTDEVFDEIRKLLGDQDKVTLFHCGSANRVGGVWLPYRVLDEGVDLETATKEAKEIGLRNKGYEAKALDYIKRKLKEREEGDKRVSVKPGINKSFVDENLDVDEYIERFEIESREVFSARKEIIKACQLEEGNHVADIGAGTGLFSRLFSVNVGDKGRVYSVDISPRFIQHINADAEKFDLKNITCVLCQEDSVNLPKASVDVAFICDTYHHFEYPKDTMTSLHRALRDSGHLILIDFERIPGKSREWLLNHVRAGKAEFRAEIESFGFKLIEEVEVAGLEENYCLKFEKSKASE